MIYVDCVHFDVLIFYYFFSEYQDTLGKEMFTLSEVFLVKLKR